MKQFMAILLAIISVFILSCHRIPEEVSEFSTLRLVWNDDPSTTMGIIWDGMNGMDSQEVAVNPYAPFTTSTLIQSFSTSFGWTASKDEKLCLGPFLNFPCPARKRYPETYVGENDLHSSCY